MHTYVLLRPGQSLARIQEQGSGLHENVPCGKTRARRRQFDSSPSARSIFSSKLEGEIKPNSDIVYIYIFSGTAFLLLLIAGVNFVNLATAQACRRMKEIGMRKVLGAGRGTAHQAISGRVFSDHARGLRMRTGTSAF